MVVMSGFGCVAMVQFMVMLFTRARVAVATVNGTEAQANVTQGEGG